MNTETIKAAFQVAARAIYVPGERYALAKINGLSNRTHKALVAAGLPTNDENGYRLTYRWSREVRKSLNVGMRNEPGKYSEHY